MRRLSGAVGLELGRAVMVSLWVCGSFYGGLRWIYGGLRWWVCGFTVMVGLWVFLWWFAVDCGGGFAFCSEFLNFFFFHFTLLQIL